MEQQHARLIAAMIEYDGGDAMRIHHFMKVYGFASAIGTLEKLDSETLFIVETAAIVHDIGIHVCEAKYGMCDGRHQEMEGPAEARKLLQSVGGYTPQQIDRVCWLVGHHHTYKDIDGADYQILVEADFLVNIYEDGISPEATAKIKAHIFRTPTGIKFLDELFPA